MGRRITAINEDARKTTYLFQWLSSGSPTRKCGRLPQHFQYWINATVVYWL